MTKNHLACGTPMSENHFGQLDCPDCFPENFFGFKTVKSPVMTENSDEVDHPEFIGQGVEILSDAN